METIIEEDVYSQKATYKKIEEGTNGHTQKETHDKIKEGMNGHTQEDAHEKIKEGMNGHTQKVTHKKIKKGMNGHTQKARQEKVKTERKGKKEPAPVRLLKNVYYPNLWHPEPEKAGEIPMKKPYVRTTRTKSRMKRDIAHSLAAKREIFDLRCPNETTVLYVEHLVNIHFVGERIGCCHETRFYPGKGPQMTHYKECALAEALKDANNFLSKSLRDNNNIDRDQFHEYVERLRICRDHPNREPGFQEKFHADAEIFLEYFMNRKGKVDVLSRKHERYWASRLQLLSGKVLADSLDIDYGPMDPVFGVLLNPTGGRIGPGSNNFLHKMWYDAMGLVCMHSAVHDAFGYMITHHNKGPGYIYMQCWTAASKKRTYVGQFSGLVHWWYILKRLERNTPYIVI